ncbi:MAG TPA: ASCH domain-containing protein [Anaerolineales bacterium]|nr:ASCH domain-containing protein [Anaerolineales bacterium]
MRADNSIEAFWHSFLATSGDKAQDRSQPEAWSFGDNPALAEELCQLVLAGIKTATCSLLWEYEADGEAIPQEGQLSIILDGQGNPRAIIETTQVTIQPFNQVDATFAYEEGEDDRSLESWRREHWRYFSRTSQAKGWQLDESMPLVCERFRLIHQEDSLL